MSFLKDLYLFSVLTLSQDVNASKLFSDEAATIFDRATSTILKHSMLLHFAYADFEEGRMKYEKVHEIYKTYLELQEIDPTLVSKSW